MRHTFIGKAAELFQAKRRRKRVQRTVAALSAVVVFVTTYMLILPAITMEHQVLTCGLEEHTHTEDCYKTVLVCEQGGDSQSASDYICGQEEAEPHTHDDSCYGLTCGQEETEGHTHDESCYETEEVLTCDEEESDGHSHDDSCYDEEGELTCGEDEYEGHSHDSGCYTEEESLTCGQEEAEPHTHDDSCYGLTCGREETEGHTHDDSCLPEQTAGEDETAEEHVHTEDCYETVLACGLEEHTHTEDCYETAPANGAGSQPETADTTFPQELPEGYVEYSFDGEDGLSVTAYAPEDAFGGQEVTLVAERLAEDSDAYAQAQQELDEAEDVTYDGFAALDVRFENADGEEVEPDGTVYVRFNVQALLPADVDEDTLSVQHHGEETTKLLGIITTGTETYVETVADSSDSTGDVALQLAQAPEQAVAADEAESGDQPAVLMDVQAEFAVDSFSTFTITWGVNGKKIEVYYVDEKGNQLSGQQSTDIQVNEDEAITLRNYASKTINGNSYQYARINDPSTGSKAQFVRYKNGVWQYSDGTWHNWTVPAGVPNPRVYLVYGNSKLGTVDTVDTKDTIDINLFDYTKTGADSGINEGKDFKFVDYDNVDEYWNWWTGKGEGVRQGIVSKTLVDRYPELNVGDKSSLAYLFNNSNIDGKKSSYTGATNLFQKDADGYYYYDSGTNFAQLDKTTKKFTVYNQPINNGTSAAAPKFLPFNTLDASNTANVKEGTWKSTGHGWNQKQYWENNYNYHFGMTVSTDFVMPKGGKVNGNDMIFEFEGDDDVWVFVDGVLVLDMGGIHDNYSGSINFATGEVKVNDGKVSDTKLVNLFAAAGKTWDSTNYKSHTFDFFYLERGAGGSNCKIKFNLPTIPKNSLLIGKELVGAGTAEEGLQDYLNNMEFKFRVLKNDSDELFLGEGKTYYLVDSETYERVDNVTHTIGADGIIKVKPGQLAVLKDAYDANTDGSYQVEELVEANFNDQYGEVQYTVGAEGSTVTEEKGDKIIDEVKYIGHKTGAMNPKNEQNTAVFTNKVDIGKLSVLKITKEVKQGSQIKANTAFDMLVKVDGEPIAVGTVYQVNEQSRIVQKTGIISIEDGETASLIMLGGASFEVKEQDEDKYTKTYEAVGSYWENNTQQTYEVSVDSNGVRGTIQQLNSVVEIKVTNADYDFAAQLPLTKLLVGFDGEPHGFQFIAKQVDEARNIVENGKSWTLNWSDPFETKQKKDVYFGFKSEDADGDYYFKVYEQSGTDESVIYDTKEYLVKVTVSTEDGKKTASAVILNEDTPAENQSLDFVNALTGNLSLTKIVNRTDGGTVDPKTEFTFQIKVSGVSGEYTVEYKNENGESHADTTVTFVSGAATDETGTATVKLYPGETITIQGLPAGKQAEITEVSADGYSVSWTEDGATAIGLPNHTSEKIGTNPNVTCTNTTGAVLPSTGGAGTAGIMSAGAALTLAAGALLLKRRKGASGVI